MEIYLSAAGLEKQPLFILWQLEAIKGLSALVGSEPIEAWKDWLAFHTVNQSAVCLSRAFDELHFDFYNKTLQGTPEERERWKRGVERVNADLGDAVGKVYVAKYFPPSSKAEVQAMVRNLLAAFDHRIDALTWMAPETKEQAKAKIKTCEWVSVILGENIADVGGLAASYDAYRMSLKGKEYLKEMD